MSTPHDTPATSIRAAAQMLRPIIEIPDPYRRQELLQQTYAQMQQANQQRTSQRAAQLELSADQLRQCTPAPAFQEALAQDYRALEHRLATRPQQRQTANAAALQHHQLALDAIADFTLALIESSQRAAPEPGAASPLEPAEYPATPLTWQHDPQLEPHRELLQHGRQTAGQGNWAGIFQPGERRAARQRITAQAKALIEFLALPPAAGPEPTIPDRLAPNFRQNREPEPRAEALDIFRIGTEMDGIAATRRHAAEQAARRIAESVAIMAALADNAESVRPDPATLTATIQENFDSAKLQPDFADQKIPSYAELEKLSRQPADPTTMDPTTMDPTNRQPYATTLADVNRAIRLTDASADFAVALAERGLPDPGGWWQAGGLPAADLDRAAASIARSYPPAPDHWHEIQGSYTGHWALLEQGRQATNQDAGQLRQADLAQAQRQQIYDRIARRVQIAARILEDYGSP